MKKQNKIVGFLLSAAIIGSILFQSFHSYDHFLTQLAEKKCHHQSKSATDITHQHKGFEKCFSCEFAFSSFVKATLFSVKPSSHFNFEKLSTTFQKEKFSFFSGISYALRGPPLS